MTSIETVENKSVQFIDLLCLPANFFNTGRNSHNIFTLLHTVFGIPLPDSIQSIRINMSDTLYSFTMDNQPVEHHLIKYSNGTYYYESYDNKHTRQVIPNNPTYSMLEHSIISNHDSNVKTFRNKLLLPLGKKVENCLSTLNENYKNHIRQNDKIEKHNGILRNVNLKHKTKITSICNYNSFTKIEGEENIKFTYNILIKMLKMYGQLVQDMLLICDNKWRQTETFKQSLDKFIHEEDISKVLDSIILINMSQPRNKHIKIFCPYIRELSLIYNKKENKYYKATYIEFKCVRDDKNEWEFLFGKSIFPSDKFDKEDDIVKRIINLDEFKTNKINGNIV